jgi:hypothetical protein
LNQLDYKEVESFINDFENARLSKKRWTHQAHLIAAYWYINKLGFYDGLHTIRERIKRHNESVGTQNTDTSGYHETLTCLYMAAVSQHAVSYSDLSFERSLALLLDSQISDKAWPLSLYSNERLFSARARREWVEPDMQPGQFEYLNTVAAQLVTQP